MNRMTSVLRSGLFALVALPGALYAEQPLAVDIKRLSMESAYLAAKTAIDHCRGEAVQIAAVVLDRGGNVQVALRDVLAADLTLRIAEEKAYAALSFNVPTSDLGERADSPLGRLQGLVMLAGGLPIEAGGELYGAIGVSGAPEGTLDEACAAAGVAKLVEELEFGG